MIRCPRPDLAAALATLLGDSSVFVFVADDETGDDWPRVRTELTDAYERTREAARRDLPVVYVVGSDDLLGRNGPGRAMVACGLLSAARTLAMEYRKTATPANVLAVEPGSDVGSIARWVGLLAGRGGPQGELVRIGPAHLGKALP